MLFANVDTPSPRGFHDLERLASEIHAEYFSQVMRLPIQWGKRVAQRRRRSIRLGSYDHQSRLIRIHPSLDTAVVPRFFIQSIIYHEYLHHVLGPAHNARFQKHERRFRFHNEAKQWLKRNLPFLLGRKEAARKPLTMRTRRVVTERPAQLQLF